MEQSRSDKKNERHHTMKLAGAYIHEDDYTRLANLAAANGRTIAGECRHLFKQALDSAQKPEKKATITALHQGYNLVGSLNDDELDLFISKGAGGGGVDAVSW